MNNEFCDDIFCHIDNQQDFLLNQVMALSKDDLNKIQLLIIKGAVQVSNKIEETVEKLEEIKEKINLLPTKDEFFKQMSEVMGELQDIREEKTAQTGQLSEHEDRLERLEKIHPEITPPL